MRRVYLASRFGNAALLRRVRDDLQERGHVVTSSWIDVPVSADEDARRDLIPDPAERAHWATIDLKDLSDSDTFVLIDPSGKRGGCYVELGYAMASGLDCIVVGAPTNVFTYLCRQCEFNDLPDLLAEPSGALGGLKPEPENPKDATK